MRVVFASLIGLFWSTASISGPLGATFDNIDGGTHVLEEWKGKPVLVVNTASQCGFTYQYAALQELYDTYKDQGLVVLAVPSGDFDQELESAHDVREFCEMAFSLDLPMADISSVTGEGAHPFYKAVEAETGFVPRWNFNKVLIGPKGDVVGTWRSNVRPGAKRIVDAITPLLQ